MMKSKEAIPEQDIEDMLQGNNKCINTDHTQITT